MKNVVVEGPASVKEALAQRIQSEILSFNLKTPKRFTINKLLDTRLPIKNTSQFNNTQDYLEVTAHSGGKSNLFTSIGLLSSKVI